MLGKPALDRHSRTHNAAPDSPAFCPGTGHLRASALPFSCPDVPLLSSLPVSAPLQGHPGRLPRPSVMGPPGHVTHVFPHPWGPQGSHPNPRHGLATPAPGLPTRPSQGVFSDALEASFHLTPCLEDSKLPFFVSLPVILAQPPRTTLEKCPLKRLTRHPWRQSAPVPSLYPSQRGWGPLPASTLVTYRKRRSEHDQGLPRKSEHRGPPPTPPQGP